MERSARRIGAAACALLGTAATGAKAQAQWEVDSATMVYSESHGRVSLVEPVVAVRWKDANDRVLGARVTLDTLTGASPNGATPASTPQTFTGPSGGKSYQAKAGETPLDDTFKDTRVAVAVDAETPLGEGAWKVGGGLNFSTEYDYDSLGGSLHVLRDLNQHNTTLSLGVSASRDQVNPVGGAHDPLTLVTAGGGGDRAIRDDDEGEGEGDDGRRGPKKNKTVVDVLGGITQVIDPHSLVRVNLVLSHASGYLTDPYKLLSVVGTDGEPLRYVYEGRPDHRTKKGVFAEYVRDVGGDTVRAGYRFQTDDWGIDSHTVELAYRWNFGGANYLEPQLRWYTQTKADFYHVALYDGQENTVSDATADYRLGGMDTWTVGLQGGHRFGNGSDLSLRVAWYRQTPDEKGVPAQAAEGLSKFSNLAPKTDAVMATVAFRFDL